MNSHRSLILILLVTVLLAGTVSPGSVHASEDEILAPYWIIYDVAEDTVLDNELMHQRVPMASLTKTMTGLLVAENLSMNDQITIVEEDLVGEASIWVQPGDSYTVRALLHGMMMRSGNDAAAALARAAGGSPDRESETARKRFIDMMNDRAEELGMVNTRFENPHGLDGKEHYSSAYDLMLLTKKVLDTPRLMQPFGARTYTGEGFTFTHSNQLPSQYEGVLGGKTGWTNNAGLCLIQLVEKDGRMLIVVLLGSSFDRWYPDAIDLLDYGWTIPVPGTTPQRAEDIFEWWRDRTDGPIQRGLDTRSWLWGPEPHSSVRYEAYEETVGGQRLVQYFDKGRMEINDAQAPITSGWYVTGGHLALELISGNHQTGDSRFVYRGPAHVPVAGDAGEDSPTYARLADLMNAEQHETGTAITLAFDTNGGVRHQPWFGDYDVTIRDISSPTGHGIASVFDEFLDQEGIISERGRDVERAIFSPRFALIGLPITEPVWMQVPVDGVTHDVLVQCFERRCLTYTPENPDDWQVEMGNIGQHYLEWQRRNRLFSLYELWDSMNTTDSPHQGNIVANRPLETAA